MPGGATRRAGAWILPRGPGPPSSLGVGAHGPRSPGSRALLWSTVLTTTRWPRADVTSSLSRAAGLGPGVGRGRANAETGGNRRGAAWTVSAGLHAPASRRRLPRAPVQHRPPAPRPVSAPGPTGLPGGPPVRGESGAGLCSHSVVIVACCATWGKSLNLSEPPFQDHSDPFNVPPLLHDPQPEGRRR